MNAAAETERERADDEPIGAIGMWVFIATEVLFFGALLRAYVIYRNAYWESFTAASRHLDFRLGTLNTAVLLTSSFAMAVAVHAAKRAAARTTVAALAATSVLGIAFLGVKAFEYHQEFVEHLAPWQPAADFAVDSASATRVELFFDFYYTMTGLHAAHLIVGLAAVWVVMGQAARLTAARRTASIEVTGLYWHFVDVVWVFLYPLLYLVGR